ncbi:MAG: SGNH/GDSL hydrolase family protein [Bacillota bacterium]
MKLLKSVSKVLMAGALITALPYNAFAKSPEKQDFDYVALGDSLAAGITPYNQDGLGYPEYLEQRFKQSQYNINLDNLGVPGYTSTHLVANINNTNIQESIKDAELVTIGIGANDLLGALKLNPALVGSAIVNVKNNLQTILTTIKQLNPNAKVYVMGYYNPFPYLSAEEQASLLPLLSSLNNVIQLTTVSNGYSFVQTEKVIAKKYETYLPIPENIHLSEEGYKTIAKEFWKVIDKDK